MLDISKMLILSREVVHSVCLDTFCNANLDTSSVMFLASQEFWIFPLTHMTQLGLIKP